MTRNGAFARASSRKTVTVISCVCTRPWMSFTSTGSSNVSSTTCADAGAQASSTAASAPRQSLLMPDSSLSSGLASPGRCVQRQRRFVFDLLQREARLDACHARDLREVVYDKPLERLHVRHDDA